MMKISNKYFFLVAVALLQACTNDADEAMVSDAALEIRAIQATIAGSQAVTRAETETPTAIGRGSFAVNDEMVFTKIERTLNPLESFSYSDIRYTTTDGTSWSRKSENGEIEKIYWSDASSAHTFVGYSLPQKEGGYSFTKSDEVNAYYKGQLSTKEFTDSTSIAAEDLLLCYSADTKAETGGMTAVVSFAHALSLLRVEVNILDYSANEVDAQVDVDTMVIGNQPVSFEWNEKGGSVSKTDNSTTSNLTLWRQSAEGNDKKKVFTFFGLTVPHTGEVPFSFEVKYDSNSESPKKYSGSFSGVELKSGVCTTLTINLNHQGEQIGTNVTYSDWNLVATPDLGKLRKKSTFMNIGMEAVSIRTDADATADDATWLYQDGETVKDIYGNTGVSSQPYLIKSAAQLLSLAKEVNSGFNFEGKYIRLDADITMQKDSKDSTYQWGGIGSEEHPFNGTFLGGDRFINRLAGSPLFVSLGAKAVVEQLHITTVGTIMGSGALANSNAGIVGGCKVIDDVAFNEQTSVGALIGSNSGTIYACYYTGSNAAQLVGSGTAAVGCYCVADHTLHDMMQENFVNDLNGELTKLYDSNSKLTPFKYKLNAGSYPTVIKE